MLSVAGSCVGAALVVGGACVICVCVLLLCVRCVMLLYCACVCMCVVCGLCDVFSEFAGQLSHPTMGEAPDLRMLIISQPYTQAVCFADRKRITRG